MTVFPSIDGVSTEAYARAARVRLAVFDVDGTLTDGRLWFTADSEEIKPFSVTDGLGLKLLQHYGMEVALITARESAALSLRARELGIRHLYQGVKNKRVTLQELLSQLGLNPEQAAYMGDDLPDLPALAIAGLAVAPANAHPWVAERVHWCTRQGGGMGAARELCDLLLAAQGHAGAVLASFLPSLESIPLSL